MPIASSRLMPAPAVLLLVVSLLLGACDRDDRRDPSSRFDTTSTTADGSGGEPGPDGADRDAGSTDDGTDAPADTAGSRTAVSDSIGFPAGRQSITGQRYNVKSGIIELRSSFMGDVRQTVYFDDYGRKEAVHANASVGGTTTRSVMVMADGKNVVYDPVRKSGTRIDMADALTQLGLGGIPNLSSLDERAKRELKYQPIAGRTVLGRETQGASIELVGTPVKVWSWEGIPLRMEATMQGNQMVVEATSLKLDIPVPAERFVVPKDVTITEYETGE